jgi:hypothetical protein
MFAGAESSEDLCTATSTRLSGIGAEGNRLGFELIVRPLGSWEVSKDPEELVKSAKERYIRVAAIDITISAGV